MNGGSRLDFWREIKTLEGWGPAPRMVGMGVQGIVAATREIFDQIA